MRHVPDPDSATQECPVCLGPLDDDDTVRLPCHRPTCACDRAAPAGCTLRAPCTEMSGHLFHYECVQGWFSEHHTCPSCRYPFPADTSGGVSDYVGQFGSQSGGLISGWPAMPAAALAQLAIGRAAQLRAWLVGDDLNIDDYGRPGGASPFLVPLAHHGLRHNAIVLPARTLYHRHGPQDAALAREWGGSVIENAWFRVVAEAGLHEQWHALLFVAVTAVRTLVEEHSVAHVHTLLEGHMREDGYVGWMQQRVLLGARFDADAARNAYSRASEVIRMARGRLRGELAMPDDELGTDS
jgi:hypothetical protein